MAFCTNCGTQVSDGTKFCPSCGQKIGGNEPASPAASVQETPTAPVQKDESSPAEALVQGVYQAAYTSPVQQKYTPPVQPQAQQQSYQAPKQSYQAPSAQSAPAQPAYAAAPKEKNPMNKKMLFIIGGVALVAILAVVLILVLGGKGDKAASADPNLGVYNATTAEMMGMEMAVSDFWEGGFTIELKSNGKCAMEIDGSKASGKWTLEGTDFHIKGGGLECDGTLSMGSLTLTNVLDMGITLGFEKEGGYTGTSSASVGTTNGTSNDGSAQNTLQQQWNGTWFGCLCINDATGDFSGIPSDFYDAYMTVNVDAQGKGTLNVYLSGVDAAFASASCEAYESGLNATDGMIAGGVSINVDNWTFLPMPDYPDQYAMGDVISDGDSLFDFSLFVKKWGTSWQAEIDSNFAIIPPSVAWYETAIANGEQPPLSGGNAPSGSTAPAQSGDQAGNGFDFSGPTATFDYGNDGMVVFTYPTDDFTYDEYWENLANEDQSLTISFMGDWSESDIQADLDRFESTAGSADYSLKKIKVAGYEATRMTYSDSMGYTVETLINFGTDANTYQGIRVIVVSYNSFDECVSDTVEAIIASVQVK